MLVKTVEVLEMNERWQQERESLLQQLEGLVAESYEWVNKSRDYARNHPAVGSANVRHSFADRIRNANHYYQHYRHTHA